MVSSAVKPEKMLEGRVSFSNPMNALIHNRDDRIMRECVRGADEDFLQFCDVLCCGLHLDMTSDVGHRGSFRCDGIAGYFISELWIFAAELADITHSRGCEIWTLPFYWFYDINQ